MSKICRGHEKGTPDELCPACILAAEKDRLRAALEYAKVVMRNEVDFYDDQHQKDVLAEIGRIECGKE